MNQLPEYLDCEVDNLHRTDEREASEEPHGSSYSRQLVLHFICSVLTVTKSKNKIFAIKKSLGNFVEGGGIEVNPNKLKRVSEF